MLKRLCRSLISARLLPISGIRTLSLPEVYRPEISCRESGSILPLNLKRTEKDLRGGARGSNFVTVKGEREKQGRREKEIVKKYLILIELRDILLTLYCLQVK